MRLKLRVALALSLLVLLVSAVAANAATRPPSTTPSVNVESWSMCVSGVGDQLQLGVWANNVTVDSLRRYDLKIEVLNESQQPLLDGVTTVTGRREPFNVDWAVVHPSVAGTYTVTLYAVPRDSSVSAPSQTIGPVVVADQSGCY
jgi:hypothetical protein